jgi:GTPase Era involved in 16S rRNA processing
MKNESKKINKETQPNICMFINRELKEKVQAKLSRMSKEEMRRVTMTELIRDFLFNYIKEEEKSQ